MLKENVAHKVKPVKEDVIIHVFNDGQVNQMLSYYRGLRRRERIYFAYRGYMLILTFLGTGIRRTEATNLKWSDVYFINFTIVVFGKIRKRELVLLKRIKYYF